MTSSAERKRAQRERRRRAGLCLECGKPRGPAHGDHGRTGAHVDDADTRYAQQAIAKGAAELAAWRASPSSLGRVQRDAIRRAALAQIAHGRRFLEELLARHGYAI